MSAATPDDVIHAEAAPKPVGAYPHARRVGNLLFLSGIGPRDPRDNRFRATSCTPTAACRYDIDAQCHAVFANVRTVLEASGARWEDLVDVTVYLTDMARDFRVYNAVWAEYFPDPARALPHDARHHRLADTDRDRTQMHWRCCPPTEPD